MNVKKIKFKMWLFSFVVLTVLTLSTTISGEPIESARFPSLISSLNIDANLAFCRERVPLEIRDVRERLEKELMLSLWDRPQVILWLKRAHRYLPHIEQTLKEGGLPDELKYVAIAESALRPHVGSKKGAMGFWQFIAGTGRKYGLVINRRIDERRNIFASTGAVVRYFKDLHDTFGSWTLAAAAFNMGENGLTAEILEQRTNDYYNLYLSLETRRYVFRILSIKMIFTRPEKYGFKLSKQDYYPPLSFDRIQLDCLQETPLRVIAQASDTYFKVIKDLNPEIRGYYLAAGKHNLLIPKGASKGFQARYQRYVKKFLETKKERTYVIKEGDNLSAIADRFDIPLPALLIWNRLDLRRPIHPGDRLIIYPIELKNGNIQDKE
jgi:membrane-bound lytic murein transglycosylase D